MQILARVNLDRVATFWTAQLAPMRTETFNFLLQPLDQERRENGNSEAAFLPTFQVLNCM